MLHAAIDVFASVLVAIDDVHPGAQWDLPWQSPGTQECIVEAQIGELHCRPGLAWRQLRRGHLWDWILPGVADYGPRSPVQIDLAQRRLLGCFNGPVRRWLEDHIALRIAFNLSR